MHRPQPLLQQTVSSAPHTALERSCPLAPVMINLRLRLPQGNNCSSGALAVLPASPRLAQTVYLRIQHWVSHGLAKCPRAVKICPVSRASVQSRVSRVSRKRGFNRGPLPPRSRDFQHLRATPRTNRRKHRRHSVYTPATSIPWISR